MIEQEALARMIAPGTKRVGKYREGVPIGQWEVIRLVEGSKPLLVLCACSCGRTTKALTHNNLSRGKTTKCRLCSIEARRGTKGKNKRSILIEMDKAVYKRLWMTVRGAIARCTNPDNQQYKDYGGRGISVYQPWIEDRRLFVEYLSTLEGYDKPGLMLDRKENQKGYEPGNLRYVGSSESNSNRRSNILITLDGKTLTAKSWARELGVSYSLVMSRLERGWSHKRALLTSPLK